MDTFSPLISLHFLKQEGKEHYWCTGENPTPALLAGSLLGSDIVRVRLLRQSHCDTTRYQVVDGGNGTLPYHSWIVTKGDEQWSPLDRNIDIQACLQPYLQGFAYSPTELRLSRPLMPNEHLYGFGERTGKMNKRGQAFPVWNMDFPSQHDDQVISMYTSIPFFTVIDSETGRAYGILVDHTSRVDMDLGKTEPQVASMTVEGDSLVVYFFAGPTLADILRQYTELTGHMPLPARWTLGYHQCRWGYISEEQVEHIASRLRTGRHPCDALWLDIDYMDGYKDFTFDPKRFPHPAQMMNRLHKQGFHVITILDPGVKVDADYDIYQQGLEHGYFCCYPNGEPFIGSVWPGPCVFPDFSRSEVRAWWGSLYQRLLDQGVDGIWNDMDEPALTTWPIPAVTKSPDEEKEDDPFIWRDTMKPEVLHRAGGDHPTGPDGPAVSHRFFHNAFGMQMARATYEGLLKLRPNSRPFVLTRSGTAGMQRYAALWTGDNTSKWEHIRLAIRMCLNIGMSGVAFVGVDIGGFHEACHGELLVRFTQLGAFMPFCRNHNATGNPGQEPWAFGEPYESACRKAIEVRYTLLPYLYTLFQQASVDGIPIIRPLFFHYPQEKQAYDIETEFLIGDSLLSAPISEPGATSRSVYLPGGTWFDYWDGTVYTGQTTYDIAAPLDRWPLFVRGNSIIPTGPVMQYVDQHANDPLTFTCYMTFDGQAVYTLYEDDGNTQAYYHGHFAKTTVSCHIDKGVVSVKIEEDHKNYQPQRKEYNIIVYVDGHRLQQRVKAGRGNAIIKLR